eukprot:1810869-Prymnesium_polylepis.1
MYPGDRHPTRASARCHLVGTNRVEHGCTDTAVELGCEDAAAAVLWQKFASKRFGESAGLTKFVNTISAAIVGRMIAD